MGNYNYLYVRMWYNKWSRGEIKNVPISEKSVLPRSLLIEIYHIRVEPEEFLKKGTTFCSAPRSPLLSQGSPTLHLCLSRREYQFSLSYSWNKRTLRILRRIKPPWRRKRVQIIIKQWMINHDQSAEVFIYKVFHEGNFNNSHIYVLTSSEWNP